jgi:hypothetical protein
MKNYFISPWKKQIMSLYFAQFVYMVEIKKGSVTFELGQFEQDINDYNFNL